eukprot:CAMPEP_0171731044 /NCGR_PEP_ID=MMETSP0991-20121206/28689_1 /TAXON_ID=483369 /ORGANISM="non described non described, Strain CCMP2098" /LENGTH=44 /DNA_ID= /DNA_START= /DNA_END= /DNA_ORIENTATION=
MATHKPLEQGEKRIWSVDVQFYDSMKKGRPLSKKTKKKKKKKKK